MAGPSSAMGWGWGPGLAIGAVTGAVVAGAIIASRPPRYVVYTGYAQQVYAPGCYWGRCVLEDVGVAILFWKSLSLWLLGCPAAALADADDALTGAREIGHAARWAGRRNPFVRMVRKRHVVIERGCGEGEGGRP